MTYQQFLNAKSLVDNPTGIEIDRDSINPILFEFQRDIVTWALSRGRSAIFADCGLGKTFMQLEWAKHVHAHTGHNVIILAPLAVARQTIEEGRKIGVKVNHYRDGADVVKGIGITNYERLDRFNPELFGAIVLDESSILKSYTGKYRTDLVANWSSIPFRLACTATPAPNDYMELGSHSEFLGVMRGSEMLSSFFINDPGNVGRYRLKGHGEGHFWRWMASWSVLIRKPSDLGYEDGSFILPDCRFVDIQIDVNQPPDGMLFAVDAHTMSERRAARRATIKQRVERVAEMVNSSDEEWLVWCDLNAESEMLHSLIHDSVQVRGSDPDEHKESSLVGFADGTVRKLVSKPSIAGWGMNFQRCRNMVFVGLSDSHEQFYQAVRRCWRFGQTRTVNCYIVTDRTEGAVVANIKRKERDAKRMADGMVKQTQAISSKNLKPDSGFMQKYEPSNKMELPQWLSA